MNVAHHHSFGVSIFQSENGDGKSRRQRWQEHWLTWDLSPWSSLKEGGAFTSLSTVSDILMENKA